MARGRWKDISYVKIRVRKPGSPKTVLVPAQVDPYPFFGSIAQIGRDVMDALGINHLDAERKEGYGDDSWPENDSGELIQWHESEAEISFANVKTTGRVVLQMASNHTCLFKDFLELVSQDYDLAHFSHAMYPSALIEFAEMRVFLSHSHTDKAFCRSLAKALRSEGIYVWLDEAEIKIGDSLIEKIQEGIDKVDYVIAVLSKSSVESSWVRKELDIAMNQEISGRHVKVMPLLRESVTLPPFLNGKLFADFRTRAKAKTALKALIASINKS